MGALRPTNPARDLYQIAELVELCFGDRLDSNGRSAVDEMKVIGRLGPLLWLLTPFDWLGLGLGRGYVWRSGKRVIGNVSLHPGAVHPWLGRGWLIANVAVHPDHRRRGIARTLMQAALELVTRLGGHWAALQVEAENTPAIALYESLGFQTHEPLSQWENDRTLTFTSMREGDAWPVRRRRPADAPAEVDLVFRRARIGAMAWTQPLEHHGVAGNPLWSWLDALSTDRWVLPDPAHPDRLLGSIWVESSGWGRSRLTLFLDPALNDSQAKLALLRHVFSLPDMEGRYVRLETTADDESISELLKSLRFRTTRTLVQMRHLLGA
jgi:ribosomal protein S18 acetylase RimI-like enzyme